MLLERIICMAISKEDNRLAYQSFHGEDLHTLSIDTLEQMKQYIQDVIDSKKSSLMSLPIGTRFLVLNGQWVGKIVLVGNVKYIEVEATGDLIKLTREYDLTTQFKIV